jgi:hypothetical protein
MEPQPLDVFQQVGKRCFDGPLDSHPCRDMMHPMIHKSLSYAMPLQLPISQPKLGSFSLFFFNKSYLSRRMAQVKLFGCL